MNIELYIENQPIELDKNVTFAITKQFEDLSNPTTIINDWTKTINIPFTKKNNTIFGGIFSPDRLTIAGDYTRMGIYFDPSLKMDFRLTYNHSILMTGYAKMKSIKWSKGTGTYEINLFGTLGKIFQELKKITFDTSSEDSLYTIDGSKYVDGYITKDLVYDCWLKTGLSTLALKNSSLLDIIGFAPNNAYNDDFDSSNVLLDSGHSKKFEDILNETSDFTKQNISASSIVGDGILPRSYGEYRSYYQLPYIYFNKLFQIFQTKAEEVTGYKIKLDGSWFSSYNPYWSKLVYMLHPFNIKNGETYDNYYTLAFYGATGKPTIIKPASTGKVYHPVSDLQAELLENDVTPYSETYEMLDKNDMITFQGIADSSISISGSDRWTMVLYMLNKNGDYVYLDVDDDYRLYKSTGIVITYKLVFSNGETLTSKSCIIGTASDLNPSLSEYAYIHKMENFYISGNNQLGAIVDTQYRFNIPPRLAGYSFKCKADISFIEGDYAFSKGSSSASSGYSNYYLEIVRSPTTQTNMRMTSNIYRSNAHFNLNDLWNNEYNVFDEILKYCKIFNLIVQVNDKDKTILILRKTKYFEDYTISDWSHKLDRSSDFIIEPILLDSKYLLFNYNDSDTYLNLKYKERFNVNYGEIRINTGYNFNTETKNLFEAPTNPSIISSDNVPDWNNLYAGKIFYTFPKERMINSKDEENKFISNFGSYYFHNGITKFDEGLRSVRITDDTLYLNALNSYMYNGTDEASIRITTYPLLDIINDNHLCTFNIPAECYVYNGEYDKASSIYHNIWSKYINERYSIKNKKIVCYLWITPLDFINFDFNHLITIDNLLYMVNKIFDYDVSSLKSTKVELIGIKDITGYTTDNTDHKYLYFEESTLSATIGQTIETKIYSSDGYKVTYLPPTYDITPLVSTAKETTVTIKVNGSSTMPILVAHPSGGNPVSLYIQTLEQ